MCRYREKKAEERENRNTIYKRRDDVTMQNKYHNNKVTVDGDTFDSRLEYRRFMELSLLEKAGKIQDLKRQVPYELIPAQYETIPTGEVYTRGKHKGEPKYKRVCIEKSVTYKADFVYTEDGKTVVEDTKSEATKTPEYILKRKLMLHVHGIRIKEIKKE